MGGPLAIHAIVRARRFERALAVVGRAPLAAPFETVVDREIAAIVSRASDTLTSDPLDVHERVVATGFRRATVVPLPPGVRADSEAAVRRFLRAERVPILEALELLDGCFEIRVHVTLGETSRTRTAHSELAASVFAEARAGARSARLIEARDGTILDAAFLVRRAAWIPFVEAVSDWERRVEALQVDVTGPWPAWDFVRLSLLRVRSEEEPR